MRIARRTGLVLVLLAAVLAALLSLGILVPRAPAELASGRAGGSHEIILVANAIHTDIALPAEPAVLERLSFLGAGGLPLDRPDVAHVLVGWGGRAFYTQTPNWSDLRPGALLASLTRDASVLHFALAPRIEPDLAGTRRLILNDAELEALLSFLESGLTRDFAGVPVLIEDAGFGAFDRFYEAKGWFNLAFGCNVWTAAALRHAGLATGTWTPMPQALLWSIDLHNG